MTAVTNEIPAAWLSPSASSITVATRAMIPKWIDHGSVARTGAAAGAARVARRMAEKRSSSQPSAAMPTDTTKAIGSSRCIGAAGTAVDTTAVMMFSGLQQFMTQKPR